MRNMNTRRQTKPSGFSFPVVQNVVSFAEMEIQGELNLKFIAEKV